MLYTLSHLFLFMLSYLWLSGGYILNQYLVVEQWQLMEQDLSVLTEIFGTLWTQLQVIVKLLRCVASIICNISFQLYWINSTVVRKV